MDSKQTTEDILHSYVCAVLQGGGSVDRQKIAEFGDIIELVEQKAKELERVRRENNRNRW